MNRKPLSTEICNVEVGKVPYVRMTFDAPNMDVVAEIVDFYARHGVTVGAQMIAPYTLEVRLT